MDPMTVNLWILAGACALTWALSLITHEHSWVDRLWSVLPIVYLWVFVAGDPGDQRLLLMAVLVTAWGLRLTFNFARKGGYTRGGEDYRWAVLRQKMRPWQFELFNLLFIVIYQNALIFAITLPALTVSMSEAPLGTADFILTLAFLAALLGETIADQQQWNFHRWKRAERAAGREANPRFRQSGLFALSRHPNFFFEQSQWWILYGFAIAATGIWLHWSIAGAALLTVLFIGSTVFTESISRSRYPEYADYQRRTSMLVPWFPRRNAQKLATG